MPMDQGRCCLCGKRSQLERKIAKEKMAKTHQQLEKRARQRTKGRFFWPSSWKFSSLLLFLLFHDFPARFQSARPSILFCPRRVKSANCPCHCVVAGLSWFRAVIRMNQGWKLGFLQWLLKIKYLGVSMAKWIGKFLNFLSTKFGSAPSPRSTRTVSGPLLRRTAHMSGVNPFVSYVSTSTPFATKIG